MGLLNLIQGRRAQAALEKADAFLSPFSLLLMLVAIGWLLVFPADVYWRRRYFSENALLESQAKCSFGINNERFELDRIGEILTKVWDANDHNLLTHESNKEIIDKVESLFSGYGLTTETQTFRYKKLPNGEFYQGTNLHGIVHAPRSDHVESIVLCASLKTGNNESNYNAIKLLSSFAYYTTKVNYWAKDVIFLVTDSGEAGVEEWLRSYHERTGYSKDASALKKRAGTIQSALAIELPPTKPAYGYSRMGTFYVSNTGQMPNLDYVNIVTSISRFQGLPSIYNGFDNDESEATFFEKYLKSARWLFGILKAQLIGQPTSIHTPFLKYRIDAMTLRGIPNTHSHHLGALDTDFTTIGRIIESITRSLNNLLEHFHQSFFFYLLPALNWYIPIGDYMPVIGLMSASLLFQAMGLWVSLRKNMYSITDMKKRIEYQSSAYNQLRSTIPGAIKTILLFHSIGLGVYVAYLGGSFIPKAFDTTALLIFVSSLWLIPIFRIVRQPWAASHSSKGHENMNWMAIKMIVNIYTSISIAILSMINLSVTIVIGFFVGIPLLLSKPFGNIDPKSSRIASFIAKMDTNSLKWSFLGLGFLTNPMILVTMTGLIGIPGKETILSWWQTILSEHFLFGATTFPVLCLLYMPVSFLALLIQLIE